MYQPPFDGFHATLKAFNFIAYHAYTIFLFLFTDFKTIIIPSTVFGIINSLAAEAYDLEPVHSFEPTNSAHIVSQTVHAFLWVCINLIPFEINNQNSPSAVAEDMLNKTWRPIPTRRISPTQAKYLMLFFYAVAQAYSFLYSGSYRQSLGLVILGTWYNNFGGADCSPLVRNLINALGYMCFTSGAMEAALGVPLPFDVGKPLTQWLFIIAGIIMSTVHLQDMYDQDGDAERGRRTVPLVIGDGTARWTIAIPMVVWGALCPGFWDVNIQVFLLSCVLAWAVSIRVLVFRSVESDKVTFRVWNCWVTLVYIMPLVRGC